MKYVLAVAVISIIISCGVAADKETTATKPVAKETATGGPCDGCDLLYEGMPGIETIKSTTTIAGNNEKGERMEITGSVVLKDGTTPAPNTVLYIYHTNADGLYKPSPDQVQGKKHGQLRNWVKTDAHGRFAFSTIRPAPYPHDSIPAHVHIFIKEPGKTAYYIDEVWFNDDPLITSHLREAAEQRGGNMIIDVAKQNKVWRGNINITLGLNIPGYK